MYGNAGNNILDGGAGADAMFGGAGNDVYFVDNAGDQVVENPGEGFDTVFSTAHFPAGGRTWRAGPARQCRPAGLRQRPGNMLFGNTGNNILNGEGGADAMSAAPATTPISSTSRRSVIENAGEGTDAVFATAHFGLSANVETLVLQGGADLQGSGNGQTQHDLGNTGNNLLNGEGGADTCSAGPATMRTSSTISATA